MSKFPKSFIIKDIFDRRLGEISYSEDGFKVDISSVKEKSKIEGMLNEFFKQGIRNLGEVILEEPIKSDNPLFLKEVWLQLATRGYRLIEKRGSDPTADL
ncbi:MAG: hypothetical protein KYQ20_00005 [Candidatus Nealsonbacteria bacterium]|nr:hypothetical protein [Candidatus Nealsonbacteria bacterium]